MTAQRRAGRILIIDDEAYITKSLKKVLGDLYNTITTNEPEDFFSYLKSYNIALVISDLKMPKLNGIDLLMKVRDKYPKIRRILLSGGLDLKTLIDSINTAEVHKVLQKPVQKQEIIREIEIQFQAYFKEEQKREETEGRKLELRQTRSELRKKEEKIQKLEKTLKTIPKGLYSKTDELLKLLIDIREGEEEFSQKLVSILEGMQTLTALSTNYFLEKNTEKSFRRVLEYAKDIELVADQYDQKITKAYICALFAYLYSYQQRPELALNNINKAKSIVNWLKDEYIEASLVKSIQEFTLNGEVNQKINERKQRVRIQIENLLKIPIPKLVSISKKALKRITVNNSTIYHFMVVKNEIPIYTKSTNKKQMDVALISGFVSALSLFLQETISEKANLETIQHNEGIFMFHKIKNIKYILMARVAEIHHRIGLRQIAYETSNLFENHPNNIMLQGKKRNEMDNLVKNIFGQI